MQALAIILIATSFGLLSPGDFNINTINKYIFSEKEEILFVGDVLLARDIERKAETHGLDYSFHRIKSVLRDYRHVVINFEGSIPEIHIPTPNFAMRFSVHERMAEVLFNAGVTVATLANNHASDYGEDALVHTKEVLRDVGIRAVGNPRDLSDDDVAYLSLGKYTVAVVPLETVSSFPLKDDVRDVLAKASVLSDFQVVSIHWGMEYVATPTQSQRDFAHFLVEEGVDAVIGHHPHVVQSIEMYEEVPIFYSLGNFIFDQYQNQETQEGLMVSLDIKRGKLGFTLLPVTSEDLHGAPRMMDIGERGVFFETLWSMSPNILKRVKDSFFALYSQ